MRTPPRLDVPTLRREPCTSTGSDVAPASREMRTPPRPEVPAPRRDRSLLLRNQIESDFRGRRYLPRSRADIVSYCRPRHVDEGGRGVPREDLRTGNEDKDGPLDRDYRGLSGSKKRDVMYKDRYERYSPARKSPGRSPSRVNRDAYARGVKRRYSFEMFRKQMGFRDVDYPVRRFWDEVEHVHPANERDAVRSGFQASLNRGNKRRKTVLEDSDSNSEDSSTDSSSSEEEKIEVVRGKRKRKRKEKKLFPLTDVQNLLRLVQGQAVGKTGETSKPKKKRNKTSGAHLLPPQQEPSRAIERRVSVLPSNRAMHRRYPMKKEPSPIGDKGKVERLGRLRPGRSYCRFTELIERRRDEAKENFTQSEFKEGRDVMDVMKKRGKRLRGVVESAVQQFSMPSWYRGVELVQDDVNVFADLGNDGFITFIHRLLETDYKACHVWDHYLSLLTTKFRELAIHHLERVCLEVNSLLGEQSVEKAMVLARAARL